MFYLVHILVHFEEPSIVLVQRYRTRSHLYYCCIFDTAEKLVSLDTDITCCKVTGALLEVFRFSTDFAVFDRGTRIVHTYFKTNTLCGISATCRERPCK